MNNNENDKPAPASREELLHFLETAPHISRRRKNNELDHESSEATVSSSDCPPAQSYIRLAAGEIKNGDAEQLLTHAAICEVCGDVLAGSLGAVEGTPSPEETAAIAELAASRKEWQERLARELAATKARKRPGFLNPSLLRHGPLMTGTSIAACLLLAAGLYVWLRQTNTPEHQLAMAYEDSRTLELRIPGAEYAGQTSGGRTRGVLADHEPAPLLDARARLARELERSPQNAHWLELQARADVLEERYDSATDVLDRLVAQGPVTAELLTDAASAYYQRGLVSGSELDRSTALDYLRRADEMAPTDPVILFNEAIVMEDRGQMMNAVEVWNRYITVERDSKWAAEGKRKLAALEQTLNRLKSHQSRIDQMLATPQAMDALAADTGKLASLDEELSTYELDRLLLAAYPVAGNTSGGAQQTRGSPCSESCMATRKLLKAISLSLETQHNDSWLADLISPNIDSPSSGLEMYRQAIQLLAHAVSSDLTGILGKGQQQAAEAEQVFSKIQATNGLEQSLRVAAGLGEKRAELEYIFALQRRVDFRACRQAAQKYHARHAPGLMMDRYPWIEGVEMITEKVCDDTPETRQAGRNLEMAALRLAETDHYRLLTARTKLRLVDDAQNAGDDETAERITLTTLHELLAADSPPYRIANTVSTLPYVESASPRRYMAELCLKEMIAWTELDGDYSTATRMRMDLARAEMRIGAMKEAQHQLDLAIKGRDQFKLGMPYTEPEIVLSKSLLEQGDLQGAAHYLSLAALDMNSYSDTWGLRAYSAARGQLNLARGELDQASNALESSIRGNEGRNVKRGDPTTIAEYAQQDHDLYAELAAVWLAQGRSPESVLALWERFRLRSKGLPVTQCRDGALDCDLDKLLAGQHALGDNLLIGQIVLLDRVLTYCVNKDGVLWRQKSFRRQDIIDTAQTLERAVSSPFTSPETAARLGAPLSDALLPSLPAELGPDSILLLEPDPIFQNLSWPVLPTSAGPLGMHYPLAELPSILAVGEERNPTKSLSAETMYKRPLVIGASVAASDEPPLPEALVEASSVGRLLHSNQIFLGKQATTANLSQTLGSATIFHFAGHALQTKDGTELMLAAASPADKTPWIDGAFLRRHPPLHCQLAVLSACSTGVREASWKRPLQDIVETLGELGVPKIVATRWQIDSQASVPFMDAFYQELAGGKSVAVALAAARRVQFGQFAYKNPYYWGAYYVTGMDNFDLK